MEKSLLIVDKFGGSSVASSQQFKKVKNIVLSKPNRQVVVVSALGKENKDDSKITDLLYLLHAHIKYNVDYTNILNMIKSRYIKIRDELNIDFKIEDEFDIIESNLKESRDYLVSRGEYLCAKLMSAYLGFKFVDSKDLIIFDYDGKINNEKTEKAIQEKIDLKEKIVVPGFYGAYPNGDIHLLSRGGSDITGSLLAKALNAQMYENWTDVSGILMANPKIIDSPLRINEITYDELRELSYMGANVLHEETIFPVQEMNIPINILNTNDPSNPGTIITKNCTDTSQVITGISGKKDFISFTVTKTFAANKTELMKKVLDVFTRYKIVIEHIPSSIDSFSVIVSLDQSQKFIYDLISEIKAMPEVKDVNVDRDIALVAIVGRNMITRVGISGKIFAIVGSNGINIKMISQGSHEIAIIFGISNGDFDKTIQVLYNNLIEK